VGCDCRLVAFLGMGLGGFGVNPFLFMGACRVVMGRCGLVGWGCVMIFMRCVFCRHLL